MLIIVQCTNIAGQHVATVRNLISALTCGDKQSRLLLGLWCQEVDVLMSAVPGELTASWTDRQTDGFSAF